AGNPAGPGARVGVCRGEAERVAHGQARLGLAVRETSGAVEQDAIEGDTEATTQGTEPVNLLADVRGDRGRGGDIRQGRASRVLDACTLNVGLDAEHPVLNLIVVADLPAAEAARRIELTEVTRARPRARHERRTSEGLVDDGVVTSAEAAATVHTDVEAGP